MTSAAELCKATLKALHVTHQGENIHFYPRHQPTSLRMRATVLIGNTAGKHFLHSLLKIRQQIASFPLCLSALRGYLRGIRHSSVSAERYSFVCLHGS